MYRNFNATIFVANFARYFAISHHICNCYPFRERRVFLFFPKENHHEQNRRCGNCCKRQQFRPTSTNCTHKPRIYHLWPYGHPRPRKWQKRHCPHRQGNCGTNFRIDGRPWSHPQRPSQKHANQRVGFARHVASNLSIVYKCQLYRSRRLPICKKAPLCKGSWHRR